MKLAHFSDLHYAPGTLEEVSRCFEHAVDEAISLHCDAAVISGDLFDHRVELHTPAVDSLLDSVQELGNAMPVLILQGTFSHDVPGSLDVFRHIRSRNGIHVSDRIEQVLLKSADDDNRHIWQSSVTWKVDSLREANLIALFSCLPTLNKAMMAAEVGGEMAAVAVGEKIFDLMRGWGEVNGKARTLGLPTIGAGHGTVNGSMTEHGVPMAGLDHEFTTGSLFAAQCDVFCLGHIHQHQAWWNMPEAGPKQLIAYAGSIGRLHYGEVRPKGWVEYNLDIPPLGVDDEPPVSYEFHETPAKRLIDLDFADQTPDEQALLEAAKDCTSAFVRIRYQINEEERLSVNHNDIRGLFADAAEVKIEPRIIPVQRQRAAGISHLPGLTDQLKTWGKVTENAAEPLIPLLEQLQAESTDKIVENALDETAK